MGKMKNWAAVLFFAIGLKAFIIPNQTFAGGDFKQKLQEKVRTRNNIQYRAPQEQAAGSYIKEEECSKPASLPMPGGLISQEAPIISSYAIYKTDYKAEIEDDVATVGGNVVFEVFKKGWTKLPLVRSDVGLIDVSINRGASFVTMQGGKYYLMIDKPGRYTLDIEFLIKASRERENGPGNFSFEVMPAPISQFEFTIAESEVEIFVEPAIKLEVKREAKKTIAWAVMPNTENITVRWTKALPKETITPVKLEPKVYVDTATYAAVGDGFIRCQGSFTYSIL